MRDVTEGRIFEQEQIAGLPGGVGVGSAADIRLFPLDKTAESVAGRIRCSWTQTGNRNQPGMFCLLQSML